MAKASIKNGYARLANDLARAIACRDFSELHYAILFATIPMTYGFQGRESFHYSRAAMAQATGRDASHVGRAVNSLVAARVLTMVDGMLGINPVVDEWKIPVKKGAENAPKVGRKTPESTGVKRPELGRKTPEKRAENALQAGLESANSAVFAEPKEKKESIKETPLTPQRPLTGLAAIAEAGEWGPGERERFFTLFGVESFSQLNLLGYGVQQDVRDYLGFPLATRQRAWGYLDAKQKAGEAITRPFRFVMAYLKDPSRFTALAGPPAPVKVAPTTRPADPLSVWRHYLIGGMVCSTPKEEASCLYFKAQALVAQGFKLDPREVDRRYEAGGIEEAGRWLFATANEQALERDRAQKEAL